MAAIKAVTFDRSGTIRIANARHDLGVFLVSRHEGYRADEQAVVELQESPMFGFSPIRLRRKAIVTRIGDAAPMRLDRPDKNFEPEHLATKGLDLQRVEDAAFGRAQQTGETDGNNPTKRIGEKALSFAVFVEIILIAVLALGRAGPEILESWKGAGGG